MFPQFSPETVSDLVDTTPQDHRRFYLEAAAAVEDLAARFGVPLPPLLKTVLGIASAAVRSGDHEGGLRQGLALLAGYLEHYLRTVEADEAEVVDLRDNPSDPAVTDTREVTP